MLLDLGLLSEIFVGCTWELFPRADGQRIGGACTQRDSQAVTFWLRCVVVEFSSLGSEHVSATPIVNGWIWTRFTIG